MLATSHFCSLCTSLSGFLSIQRVWERDNQTNRTSGHGPVIEDISIGPLTLGIYQKGPSLRKESIQSVKPGLTGF